MKKILFISVLVLVGAGVCFAGRDDNMEPAKGFFLPKGNPEAGRQAFKDLQCLACHAVEKDAEFSTPSMVPPGPVLGVKQGNYATGWIANSIVSPSHTIALDSNGEVEGTQLSRMGDFTGRMTVRQLIDLVAYLKSMGDETAEEDEEPVS